MQGRPCTPGMSAEPGIQVTSMTCVVPDFASRVTRLKNISYTIRVGAAPGPDLTNGALTLDMKPNPVFSEDGSAIADSEVGGLLFITVSAILSGLMLLPFCLFVFLSVNSLQQCSIYML